MSTENARELREPMRRVGHQMRDGLGGILMLTDIILRGLEGDVSEDVLKDVQLVNGMAADTLAVIDKLLELVYPEAKLDKPTSRNIGPLILECCTQIQCGLPAGRLVCTFPDVLPKVRLSPSGFKRVMEALIASLLQVAMQEVITVTAAKRGKRVVVSIWNGQRTEAVKLISLEGFLEAAPRQSSALELLVARRFIQTMGGKLRISKASESGSLGFTWTLAEPK